MDVTSSDTALRGFLHGLPGVDEVGARARADVLAKRSVKADAKRFALDLAISMIDLTTLEGQDTPGKVRAMCAKARNPGHGAPPVAAVAVHDACGDAHLKVILETGELGTLDAVRRASWLAMLSGADFIKTSTGKVAPAATLPVTLVMLEAVRDFRDFDGRRIGVKAAGGIRTAKDAVRYLVLVNETAGEQWLDPRYFRLGASSLLNDLLMQRVRMETGRYSGPDYMTVD
jgi:deoxyribose-phosphate aldolase